MGDRNRYARVGIEIPYLGERPKILELRKSLQKRTSEASRVTRVVRCVQTEAGTIARIPDPSTLVDHRASCSIAHGTSIRE